MYHILLLEGELLEKRLMLFISVSPVYLVAFSTHMQRDRVRQRQRNTESNRERKGRK